MKINLILFLNAMILLNIAACDPKEPEIENEEELITTVKYKLTPQGGGASVELTFVDKDGQGGNAPIIAGGIISKGVTYDGELTLLNESGTKAESITDEVVEESDDHQVFYTASSELKDAISVTYKDKDKSGNPLGVKTGLVTKSNAKGSIKITLRHLPNKKGSGVTAGDITNAGGETDIEVSIPLEVK